MKNDLRTFIVWYSMYQQSRETSVLETCICGYFHTYTKEAKRIIRKCEQLGLIRTMEDNFALTQVQKEKFEIVWKEK